MSDYFDRFESAMDAALERGRHQPWYRRIATARRGPAFLSVAAAACAVVVVLVVVAPLGSTGRGQILTPVATVAQGPGATGGAGELLSVRLRGSDHGGLRDADSRACGTASPSIEDTSSIDASLPRPLSSTGS